MIHRNLTHTAPTRPPQVRAKLEEEHMQFENVLREMERDIRRSRAELNELKRMHADAQLSRDVAVKEMHKQEEQNNVERKKREVELKAMRQQAEERRQHYERSERRQVRVYLVVCSILITVKVEMQNAQYEYRGVDVSFTSERELLINRLLCR